MQAPHPKGSQGKKGKPMSMLELKERAQQKIENIQQQNREKSQAKIKQLTEEHKKSGKTKAEKGADKGMFDDLDKGDSDEDKPQK